MPLAAAVAVTVAGGVLGAILDKAAGHDILVLFTVFLSAAAAISLVTVVREHLFADLVAVPLTYLLLVIIIGLASHPGGLAYTLVLNFTIKAPATLVSTGVGIVVAGMRRLVQH